VLYCVQKLLTVHIIFRSVKRLAERLWGGTALSDRQLNTPSFGQLLVLVPLRVGDSLLARRRSHHGNASSHEGKDLCL
jgi:hypothetical protein